jgi:hypothetical protein
VIEVLVLSRATAASDISTASERRLGSLGTLHPRACAWLVDAWQLGAFERLFACQDRLLESWSQWRWGGVWYGLRLWRLARHSWGLGVGESKWSSVRR